MYFDYTREEKNEAQHQIKEPDIDASNSNNVSEQSNSSNVHDLLGHEEKNSHWNVFTAIATCLFALVVVLVIMPIVGVILLLNKFFHFKS